MHFVVRIALLDVSDLASVHSVKRFGAVLNQNRLVYGLSNDELFSDELVVDLMSY